MRYLYSVLIKNYGILPNYDINNDNNDNNDINHNIFIIMMIMIIIIIIVYLIFIFEEKEIKLLIS